MMHAKDPNAPIATRMPMPEHYSAEPDNTALYIPKGLEHATSMQQTRFVLPYCDGAVRSHAIVALTPSAITVDRRRSWEQLHRMADAGDEQAIAVLEALQGFTLD
jgi:hypothetical protein